MPEVYINKSAKFLPNDPVSNEEMEDLLGKISDEESKAKRIVLRNNGITKRYYALDREGHFTHTNAELTFHAIQQLFDDEFTPQKMEVLSCGTSTPDLLIPSHAAMVHGLLKNKSLELNSSSGVCCSGMNALKYGFMSIKSGNSTNAVCTGSEHTSSWLTASRFEVESQHIKELEKTAVIAFDKEFLRWMLSDGAGAILLEDKPKGELSLKIEWIDFFSYAHELETCMYAGGDKSADGTMKPWTHCKTNEWSEKSIFALKQDVRLLNENILEKGAESIQEVMKKHALTPDQIDYLLPHLSSHYFADRLHEKLVQIGMDIPKERWFMNLREVGNVGAASIFLMLEELMSSKKLKSGDHLMLLVPESGRFSYAYAYLTVV